ncbi:hypothetical protein [Lysobacter sp. Hz 25]|uniref:hypothetical protein n=1 Tax=Lysobacter sp. Hz 25 TaxID=3383698 RepID=UPI0038D3EB64
MPALSLNRGRPSRVAGLVDATLRAIAGAVGAHVPRVDRAAQGGRRTRELQPRAGREGQAASAQAEAPLGQPAKARQPGRSALTGEFLSPS